LTRTRSSIHEKKKLIAMLHCPPELQTWQTLHAPLMDASEVELIMPCKGDAPFELLREKAISSLPLTVNERASVEAKVVAMSAPRLERVDVPGVLFEKAFIPFTHPKTGLFMRRPCAGDVSVFKSSAPHMGRLLVSLRPVQQGRLVFAESPWLSVSSDDSAFQGLLPQVLQDIWRMVCDQHRVFEAQPHWDRRLVAPFLAYLDILLQGRRDSVHRDVVMLPQLLKSLSNPLKDMDANHIDALLSFAQFLRAALPPNLESIMSEDEICRFLATFQTNAASFQSTATHMLLLDPSRGSTGSSVYATGPQVRCLLGLTSLMEHSCQPNATLVWHRTSRMMDDAAMIVEVRALRHIEAGERLCIAYVPTVLAREERQSLLWSRYWFHCQCARCCDSPDLLRSVVMPPSMCPSSLVACDRAVMVAPVGEGRIWRSFAPSCEGLSFDSEGARAAVLLESNVAKRCAQDPSAVLDCCLSNSACPTAQLSVFHALVLRSFVALCSTASAESNREAFSQQLEHLLAYGSLVTTTAFHNRSAASLVSLLQRDGEDPTTRWFDQVKDSAAVRRQRFTGMMEVLQKLPDVTELARDVVAVNTETVGDATTCTAFCVAVWELLFSVMQSAITRSLVDGQELQQAQQLRSGLALGLWLMQSFGLENFESTRAMQWQAVLLERAAMCTPEAPS
jgi:hypothetical protein